MSDTLFIGIIVFCGVLILAQLAIIYGLVNRLIRANGQTAMNAKREFDEVIGKVAGSRDKKETTTPPKIVRESFKVTL